MYKLHHIIAHGMSSCCHALSLQPAPACITKKSGLEIQQIQCPQTSQNHNIFLNVANDIRNRYYGATVIKKFCLLSEILELDHVKKSDMLSRLKIPGELQNLVGKIFNILSKYDNCGISCQL
jgi:hypothetical protein